MLAVMNGQMPLRDRIATLSNLDAELCLKGIVKQMADANPELGEILSSPTLAAKVVESVGTQTGAGMLKESAVTDRDGAIRAILLQMANDPVFAPRLDAWLSGSRPLLLEPITTTLILAGVVIALSTHVKIDYENKDRKKNLKIKVEKKPSSKSIIQKILSFAHR
jgi:hypothetical protein